MAHASDVRSRPAERAGSARCRGKFEGFRLQKPPDVILQYRFLLKDDFDPVKLSNF